jgi:hypothetical protein
VATVWRDELEVEAARYVDGWMRGGWMDGASAASSIHPFSAPLQTSNLKLLRDGWMEREGMDEGWMEREGMDGWSEE